MENDRDDRQKILVALLAGRESYIVLHKYGESTRMRGKGGGEEGCASGSVQPRGYSSDIKPASFSGPPTLKRDGPKQTRSGTAETVLLE